MKKIASDAYLRNCTWTMSALALATRRKAASVISRCSLGKLHQPPKSSGRPKFGAQKSVAVTTTVGLPRRHQRMLFTHRSS